MSFESVTTNQILDLIKVPKQLINPQARAILKSGHKQVNYNAIAQDGSEYRFQIYMRQNLKVGLNHDYSCGISWLAPNEEHLTLKRYNGPSHNHVNRLENNKLGFTCHIHTATEKYIKANKKPEGFAEPTKRYKSIDGALHCLVKDCNIKGLDTSHDSNNQTELFGS